MLWQGELIGVNVAHVPSGFLEVLGESFWGKGSAELYGLTNGEMEFSVSVSLSDPENVEFIRSAESRGYQITHAQ